MVRLRVFGPVFLEGHPSALQNQPKRPALHGYHAISASPPSGPVKRDKDLALSWPELPADRARRALNQALHVFRSELSDGTVITPGHAIGIYAGLLSCDAVESAMLSWRCSSTSWLDSI